MTDHFVSYLGNAELAQEVAQRAYMHVPAYRRFLDGSRTTPEAALPDLPCTDKEHYLLASSYAELLADDYDRSFTIFRSSGSSGQSFYWPQLKDQQRAIAAGLRRFLESTFAIDRRKTLAIVGLALGSWIGGDHVSWALKSAALEAPYPFSVFSPGNHHDEIIEMIGSADGFADQFLLFVCPSAIAHLMLRAEQMGRELPLSRIRYVVLGEPFPESVRTRLRERAGATAADPVMVSIYGSADTGVLGVESAASVMIRGLLGANPQLARSLGFQSPIPHLFHVVAEDAYLEAVDGELCITRWQGIPLVRYNLHDSAELVRYRALRDALLASEIPAAAAGVLRAAGDLPDVVAISGRADQCLILCGTNLTESILDEAVRCQELSPVLTGAYRARVEYEGDRQRLAFDLEFKGDALTNEKAVDDVYLKLAAALGRAQPEFLDDWRNVYRAWDGDRERRILKIQPIAWPGLSGQEGIKQRGIQP